jgi:hypothetical protein
MLEGGGAGRRLSLDRVIRVLGSIPCSLGGEFYFTLSQVKGPEGTKHIIQQVPTDIWEHIDFYVLHCQANSQEGGSGQCYHCLIIKNTGELSTGQR